MRKRLLMAACAAAMFLSACGTPAGIMNAYSEMDLLKNSDILSLVEPSRMEGLAESLAVISLEENAAASAEVSINAKAALLINAQTNDALYYKNVYEPLAPASLTKLMTALMILKYGNMDDTITITEDMIKVDHPDAQMAGFSVGDKILVRDMFNTMLIYSGNDTSNALAIYLSGSIKDFTALMNEEARQMGAMHTHFVNACGLDEQGHETCAYDLYLMFKQCLTYEDFCNAIDQSSYTVNYTSYSGESVSKTLDSTNLYLTGTYSAPEGIHVVGGKTGTTENAGTCLMLYSTDELGTPYISLVLGSSGKPELYQQMSGILSIIQKN